MQNWKPFLPQNFIQDVCKICGCFYWRRKDSPLEKEICDETPCVSYRYFVTKYDQYLHKKENQSL